MKNDKNIKLEELGIVDKYLQPRKQRAPEQLQGLSTTQIHALIMMSRHR